MKARKKQLGSGVWAVLLVYWVVLVLWQNIGGTITGSVVDMVLKLGLLGVLVVFYLFNARHTSLNVLLVFLFGLCMTVSFWVSGEALSSRTLIVYIYPFLLAFVVFAVGNDFQINRRELEMFLKGIIVVATYAAIYAILFCRDEFLQALSMSGAYGNELNSFFVSNHEYGMYLMYAIVACIILLATNKLSSVHRAFYLFLIAFLGLNLILTFSRTTIMSLLVIVLVYGMFASNKTLRRWLWAGVVSATGIFLASPSMRSTVELLAFKGKEEGDYGVRSYLIEVALDMFREGTTAQKIFGQGYGVREAFERYSDHGSVHNAYLQVLLYFGVIGVVFLLITILCQLKANIRLYQESGFYSVTFCAMLLAGAAMMITNTAIIFTLASILCIGLLPLIYCPIVISLSIPYIHAFPTSMSRRSTFSVS